MALIKNVLFLKKWDELTYKNKVLTLVNPIASVVDEEVLKGIEGYWPDIYSLSFKAEDEKIKEVWPVDGVSTDLQSRSETIVGIQSADTLMLFDVKMYESYPPNAGEIFALAVNDGVKVNTRDDLFR